MKKARLDKLTRKLNMEFEMQPLLNSGTDGYERFEKAVDDALNRYGSPLFSARAEYRRISPDDLKVLEFKRYYGIGCQPETLNQIAKARGVEGHSCRARIREVMLKLIRYHRKDIWYNSL